GERSATNRLSGTITWLPHAGQVIRPGRTLFRVDGAPVVLMDGALPAYRTLKRGIDDGRDVRQLERALGALGYDPGVVDETYTASTAAAVRNWQDDLGLDKTGEVQLGRVVFLPGARRVTDVKASLGSTASVSSNGTSPAGDSGHSTQFASFRAATTPTTPTTPATTPATTPTTPATTPTTPATTPTTPTTTPTTPTTPKTTPTTTPPATPSTPKDATGNGNGTPNGNGTGSGDPSSGGNAPATEVLVTSSTRRVVTAKLDAADQQLAARGRRVRVELPDGRIVSGRIASVGTVATADASQGGDPAGGAGTPKITVTIRLGSTRTAGRLDQAPVSVQFARTTRRNVLAVPVQALVARPGGRYALERADGRLVDVVPGVFANGYVELTGGRIRAGDRVRVPA
ncbi:MAG: Peptidoglycan-binding domain 1 protein, partial [Solirubrobacterales bacterium]|nr:Peptidoglycan-binding domain 1 protein [Solirubrobacterales bacterium]